jgi:asparagine synthase (glutamine-hydrolysing)
MLAASDYWQPDAYSQVSNHQESCHLAKASLFNTALSYQDQAYKDTQTGDIITANARLDNRSVLIKQLGLAEEANSLPDGQLILKAYQYWGKESPKYLLGDFAFIIWDESRQTVFCARDHFGVKVLLFSRTEKGIMISNEPNAFFTSDWLKKSLKESWLVDLIWNLGPTPVETAYKGLEVLPAGHCMEVNADSFTMEAYWHLDDDVQWENLSDDALLFELKKRFHNAVSVRLQSEFPLACELSEGLDSNGIAGYAAQMKPHDKIHTLSYSCVELTNETKKVWGKTYQDIFAMLAMHDNLHPIWTSETSFQEDKKKYIENIGGVFAFRGGWLLHCKLTYQQGARVLLSGWGGDHCVSTYGDFYESELFIQLKWRELYTFLHDKNRRGRGPKAIRALALLFIKHLFPTLSRWKERKRGGLEQALWQRSRHSFLKKDYIHRYQCKTKLKAFTDNYRRNSVKAHHQRELFEIGLEHRLIDSELSARMYRLEYRFPMLDVPLVEFTYNLPSHLKIHNGVERYHFRKILEGFTTERIQWRMKADVDHPNRELFGTLGTIEKQYLHDILNSSLLETYCHTSPLEDQNPHARFMVNQFQVYQDNFQYFIQQNIQVGES